MAFFRLDTIAACEQPTFAVLVPVDVSYSTEGEPIHMDVALNETTKNEDKHTHTHKYVDLVVYKVAVIAESGRTSWLRLRRGGTDEDSAAEGGAKRLIAAMRSRSRVSCVR